jgi:uncharacterized protein YutE (UPF0331/DUF86 family)
VTEKVSLLPQEPGENVFLGDALFYRIQISIDACMDIIAMPFNDLGILVGDDHENIDPLKGLGLMDAALLDYMHKLNGLRNVLVHKYNKIENELISSEKDTIVTSMLTFITAVEEIIDARFDVKKDP